MITAESVRAERVVQIADTTPLTERYGYKTAATPAQIMAARDFCATLAKECEAIIDEHFTRLRDIGENPYRDAVKYRDHYRDDTMRWATRIVLMSRLEFDAKHALAFKGEGKLDPAPDPAVIYRALMDDVCAMYKAAGFETYGPFEDTQGTRTLLMRDPHYVKARQDFEAVVEANQRGLARDQTWWGRLRRTLGAKPFKPRELPSPGPEVPRLVGPASIPALLPPGEKQAPAGETGVAA